MNVTLPFFLKDNSAVILMPLRFGNDKTRNGFAKVITELPATTSQVVCDCKLLIAIADDAEQFIADCLQRRNLPGLFQNADSEISRILSSIGFLTQSPEIIMESNLLGPQ
ncbi:MAG: hypothetical protein PHC51_12240 [bacterium]|nr:hypothetical protein [bacterium]